MDAFTVLTLVVGFTAIAAWANDRFFHLPSAIGVMLAGLLVAGGVLAATGIGWIDDGRAIAIVKSLHFDTLLIAGHGSGVAGQGILLGVLLFASALRIEPASMTRQFGFVAWLATVGVVLTAIGTALGFKGLLALAGDPSNFLYLMLFGAILAPTDPVAAISLLRQTSAPTRVREIIAGESLFNDGISIVLFLFLLAMITGKSETPFADRWVLGFVVETGGALVVGLAMGGIGLLLVRSASRASVVVLVTMAVVLAIGTLVPMLHVSCPVTSVVAGLVIGRAAVLREREEGAAIGFWGLVEQILTAVLFLMIGLELLTVELSWNSVLWSLSIIPILLAARFVALLIPWAVVRAMGRTTMSIEEVGLMTWCGLRGGVSIAMAIALPITIVAADGQPIRSHAMVATIIVVISTVLIQGLSVERMARIVQRRTDRRAAKLASTA
ncbi:MAG: sodium:proton antiporter [Phycisphaerales bacterium]|jgi:CPA1 family monovalent cation:H+ antiporter|nr:sodium:proton antiporter [Phycisphaerales bacterium]MDP6890507.1 sodium:proton antiporter [Phycisphaerales bacterium]